MNLESFARLFSASMFTWQPGTRPQAENSRCGMHRPVHTTDQKLGYLLSIDVHTGDTPSTRCCITIPSSVTKSSSVQKTYGHSPTFLIFTVTLTISQDTPAYDAVLSNKQTSSLEDTVEIVITWLYKPSLCPWTWTQQTKFSVWYSASW